MYNPIWEARGTGSEGRRKGEKKKEKKQKIQGSTNSSLEVIKIRMKILKRK